MSEFEQIFNPTDRKPSATERIGHFLAALLAGLVLILLISGAIWAIVKTWTSIASMM